MHVCVCVCVCACVCVNVHVCVRGVHAVSSHRSPTVDKCTLHAGMVQKPWTQVSQLSHHQIKDQQSANTCTHVMCQPK